jgi:phospholipase/carboxylesterase
MTHPILDGPRLAPLSGSAKMLVVFLHGYGADGRDLIDIGREWQKALPDAAFISPHAPEPCGMGQGRQWFSLTFRDESERWRGCVHAAPTLNAFLDSETAKHGLGPDRIILVGFSQGTMMALHVALRRRPAPMAVVGYSGMLVTEHGKGPEALKAESPSKPPILLVHGSEDQVIPLEALFMSSSLLGESGVPTEFHMSLGLPHSIDREGLRHGLEFVTSAAHQLVASKT